MIGYAVEIRQGVITAFLVPDVALPKDLPHFYFPQDNYLAPGFIDCHIHGSNGADVMDADPDALRVIENTLLKKAQPNFGSVLKVLLGLELFIF